MNAISRTRQWYLIAATLALPWLLPGCRVVGGIFKAGVWVGVIAIVVVLGIVGGLVAAFSRGARA